MIEVDLIMQIHRLYDKTLLNISILKKDFYFENDTGEMSSKEENSMKAFIVLSHAEIENFLEQICLNVLEYQFEICLKEKKAGLILASLFMWSKDDKPNNYNDRINRSHNIISKYKSVVADNHGIKRQHIKKLLDPLGISIDNYSVDLLNDIEMLASHRNNIAHTNQKQIKHQLNFRDIILLVDRIMANIKIVVSNLDCLYR